MRIALAVGKKNHSCSNYVLNARCTWGNTHILLYFITGINLQITTVIQNVLEFLQSSRFRLTLCYSRPEDTAWTRAPNFELHTVC